MSKSLSVCPECHDEWADDCFDDELGICRMCIREMNRKADAYGELVGCLRTFIEHDAFNPSAIAAAKLLQELGEPK